MTTRRNHLKLLTKSSLLTLAAASGIPANAKTNGKVTKLVMEFMGEHKVPGFSIAVAKEGRIICREAYGVANIEAGEKLTVDHRFRIASISKPITSAAIFVLVEQGKLKLDDPVFGEGALLGITNPGEKLGAITVRHLLTHTSGGWKNDKSDPMFKHLEKDHLELISWAIKNLPQEHAPGKEYAYSNFGYCLLGRIIENVSGQTYEDFVKEKVLRPSGIKMMELARRTGALENEVTYYTKGKPVDFKMNVRRMDAHGGWVGTPTDLVKFGLRVDGFPTKEDILTKETIQIMSIREGVNPNYACGWSVNTIGNCWHGGSLPGLTSLLVRTSSGYCWAACANTRKEGSGSAVDKLMWNIVKAL